MIAAYSRWKFAASPSFAPGGGGCAGGLADAVGPRALVRFEATAAIRGLASLFSGFAGPDDLVRAGLLAGFDPPAVELLRAAFASPRPWTAEIY